MSSRSYVLPAAIAALSGISLAQAPAPSRPQAAAPHAPMMASVDSNLFEGLRYRLVGPSRGGRVTTVTGVPSQPKTFYMGVASGGVFSTTDGGENWVPITDGKVPVASTGSIAVAESDPNIIYLGTGSDGVRSNVSTGRGVYRTADGGKTWEFRGTLQRGPDGRVAHPSDESRHRLGRGVRRHLQAEHRARRLQDDRRRQDVAQDALRERLDGRDGCRAPAG